MITFSIKVEGKEYPCAITMAAMDDFKEARGIEPHEAKTPYDILRLVYYSARAAAERHGDEYPYTERAFLNALDPEEGAACINAYAGAGNEESKKKDSQRKAKA